MKISFLVLVASTLVACGQSHPNGAALVYPETARVDHTDDYHGTVVADPYRWLEDDVRENEDVAAWVDAQNEVTFAYLESIGEREAIRARLEALWNYERFGLPVKEGGRYYFAHNDGLKNQDVIYTQDSLDDEPRVLIDPNTWSEDGTVAMAAYYPSPDGRYVAYLVQDAGSDWRIARVLDLESGELLADELEWLKYTALSWKQDGSGFYYSRFPASESSEKFQSLTTNHTVYFHRIGTSQEDDAVAYARPDHPDWGFASNVTDDGRYLVITIFVSTDNRYQIAYQDLEADDAGPVMLIEGFDYEYTLAGNIGGELLFKTTNDAPHGRLIAIDVDNPDPENWREIIPETEDVLESVSYVGGRLIGAYIQDAWSLVNIYDLDGNRLRSLDLPGIGSVSGFKGKPDDPETFFSYESFNTPRSNYRLDVQTGNIELTKRADVDFDSEDYTVKQVFYESKDGTRVPMFIAHRKDVVADGKRPTMLFGYGGFNISMRPSFSVVWLSWMEMGGVFAVANLRGGGEYGEEWHKAGTKLQKQNVFDDFIAAGEYLIEAGYTNSSRLAIFGGSNGGLLVGAVTNQRPDLFGAALPAVGVMDMLRFQKFTAGRYWVDDYGSSDNAEEFKALYAYSPYHNVKEGTEYPAVLVTTADTDDRVVPGHSFKYAAAIQAAQAGDAPVLIRIETRAGHGAGTPTSKTIEAYADRWAFLVRNLDMQLPEGYGE